MELTTLKQIFEGNKAQLAESLQGKVLPADSEMVQSTITEYFNVLFDEKGIYRENLTQAEDYILQSAMTLLNAQQNMAKEIAAQSQSAKNKTLNANPQISELKNAKKRIESDRFPHVMAGSAVGSVGGALLLGTWGALFGAIAGTALVLYSVSAPTAKTHFIQKDNKNTSPSTSLPLNVDVLLSIIENICESVDELISTFRSQIKKVVHKYENREKPTIERDYRFLLEGIQSLLGYKRTHSEEEDKYIKKLQLRIEDVGEVLENYNLEVVDFDGNNEYLFEVVTGQDVEAQKMVYPAIVKDGNAVLKGKIFTK